MPMVTDQTGDERLAPIDKLERVLIMGEHVRFGGKADIGPACEKVG